MKTSILLCLTLALLASCKKENKETKPSPLIGKWKLIEVLADPGDGSGTFTPVESEKILEFNSNGSISSNGNLCDISTQSDNPSSGTYSALALSFISTSCPNPNYSYILNQSNNQLIITYHCIEPCKAKYVRI